MSRWRSKATGEIVEAFPLIATPENKAKAEELFGDTLGMVLAIAGACPGDWLVKAADHSYALTPEAFERTYEPLSKESGTCRPEHHDGDRMEP